MILLLLLFQATFGGVNLSGVSSGSTTQTLPATDCATVAQATWDSFSWQVDPFDVTAANTQASAGCSADGALYPTSSLP